MRLQRKSNVSFILRVAHASQVIAQLIDSLGWVSLITESDCFAGHPSLFSRCQLHQSTWRFVKDEESYIQMIQFLCVFFLLQNVVHKACAIQPAMTAHPVG